MSLRYEWRQAGTTRRAHLVLMLERGVGRHHAASISACGVVRFAAWMPVGDATTCGLCRRLEALWLKRLSRAETKEVTP